MYSMRLALCFFSLSLRETRICSSFNTPVHLLYSLLVEQSLKFEWDDSKNKKNLSLHKISFEAAKYVWNDPFRIDTKLWEW